MRGRPVRLESGQEARDRVGLFRDGARVDQAAGLGAKQIGPGVEHAVGDPALAEGSPQIVELLFVQRLPCFVGEEPINEDVGCISRSSGESSSR